MDAQAQAPQTYASYLAVDELLALQRPRSCTDQAVPEHDEMLFIVIHQVYELWFKQILHELDLTCASLDADDHVRAEATLVRVLRILKVGVAQLDVLETMTPLQFKSFRDRLDSASGFQSAQFREIEFLLGHKRERIARHFAADAAAHAALEARHHQPSLWRHFLGFLSRQGFPIAAATLAREVSAADAPCPSVQGALVEAYRHHPPIAALCERLVDLDEGLQEWRYRHVKMVERTIGAKIGTGGSAGAAYLRETLFQPLFEDLWTVRSRL